MAKDSHPHIFIKNPSEITNYTSPKSGGRKAEIPDRDRKKHGIALKRKFEKLWKKAEEQNKMLEATGFSSRKGVYVEFKSKAGFSLITKSLENISQGIRLLNIREVTEGDKNVTLATVYIPHAKASYFLKKIEGYLEKETRPGTPKNKNLINSIEGIQLAVLTSFWRDDEYLMPTNQPVKCEVWLRVDNNSSEKSRENSGQFSDICSKLSIAYFQDQTISFPERSVVLIEADKSQLLKLIEVSDQIAEFRRAKETARFWLEQNNIEQSSWVQDLKSRLSIDNKSQVSICILDTGINNGHELVAPVLSDEDCHTVKPEWDEDDKDGHGTLMSGLAIYGDLQKALETGKNIKIRHKLESVKLIPKSGQSNPKELYGQVTQQGVSKAEIEKPENKRILCMAVTSKDGRDKGRPSSWSGAIDQITSGAEDSKKRLFTISAGNIDNVDGLNYPGDNSTNAVHDPAQSWNALTIGAYTEKDLITDPELKTYSPLAKKGELSPFSTTSLIWQTKKCPIKPDLVLEGGNIAVDGANFKTVSEDLSLLSLYHKPQERQFEMICATSASTAQASWMASQIQVQYPEIWPETIRALMVHSAEWNETMKRQFWNPETSEKDNYRNVLRTFGYGVPSLDRAVSSYDNSLTLVSEQEIQPFTKKDGGVYSTKDMHFYKMPWPKDVLKSLPDGTSVRLRFTLSYFIEPGPGEIGWEDRYRYPSHGLRFSLCQPHESEDEFKKRINKNVREEGEAVTSGGDGRWFFGSNNRDLGSIHSDIWEGSAKEIAECNLMAVYPTIGWWRERHHLGKYEKKARYSLIVSLSTPEEDIDIYTSVATQIGIPITT